MDVQLTWSVSFDQGQTWQPPGFIQTDHTMFVTLGNPMGFPGGDFFVPSPHVTAARMNHATDVLKGIADSDSSVQKLQATVPGAFGRGEYTIQMIYGTENPWVALDSPNQGADLDCYNLAAIGVVQLLEAGIDSAVAAEYPTPDGNATTQRGLPDNPQNPSQNQSQWTDVLKYYLSDGATVNIYEGFVALNQNGQAVRAYTFFPTMGPFAPWTSPEFPYLPSTSLGQLAFQVMYQELLNARTGAPSPWGGQQCYFSTATGAADQCPVPFLGFTQ
jgi:hypothetical protein